MGWFARVGAEWLRAYISTYLLVKGREGGIGWRLSKLVDEEGMVRCDVTMMDTLWTLRYLVVFLVDTSCLQWRSQRFTCKNLILS